MYKKSFSARPSRNGGFRGGSRFGSRPSHGGAPFNVRGSRPSRPRGGFGSRKGMGQYIDPAKFVNKAVITEEMEVFVPEHAFTDFAIGDTLKQNIVSKGYVAPTPIQDKVIPHVLAGQDVVGIANTGTGKTAAFLIPLIHKVTRFPKEAVLILVPTRELALQINEELRGFVKNLRVYSTVCVGGVSISPQLRSLRQHNQFVIGTPGRVKDLIERKALNLSHYATVVLDEADRMLDMGFIGDMRYVMSLVPKERQTLFFSATMSPEISKLVGEFLKEPVRISVKTGDTAKSVDQDVVKLKTGEVKIEVLEKLLRQPGFDKVLIFGRTKHGVERLTEDLVKRGIKAQSIHGNKNHNHRQKALALFKDDHVQVLVATDVAARGLDISGVSHVINYDIPGTYEDYVHRIGRTGRGGKTGKALTFI